MCDICGKHFAASGDLTRLGLAHSREKLYKCAVCGKGFTQP